MEIREWQSNGLRENHPSDCDRIAKQCVLAFSQRKQEMWCIHIYQKYLVVSSIVASHPSFLCVMIMCMIDAGSVTLVHQLHRYNYVWSDIYVCWHLPQIKVEVIRYRHCNCDNHIIRALRILLLNSVYTTRFMCKPTILFSLWFFLI